MRYVPVSQAPHHMVQITVNLKKGDQMEEYEATLTALKELEAQDANYTQSCAAADYYLECLCQ